MRSFNHYSCIFQYKGEIKPKIHLLNFQKLSFNRAPLILEYKTNLANIKIMRHLAGKPLFKHQNHSIERQDKNKPIEDGILRLSGFNLAFWPALSGSASLYRQPSQIFSDTRQPPDVHSQYGTLLS